MPQSFACVHIHLVFSTKNRRPLIADRFREELHAYIGGRLESLGCLPMRINSVDDHIHLLFDLSRTRTISEVVEDAKSGSSKWVKAQGPDHASFAWQSGYAAFSVSESNVAVVRGYIENQREHHRRRTFQDELRELLERHGVVYDERYVWD